jgi:hypothetical protein
MKRDWSLKPNLLDCLLERRIVPAIANLGTIVLTSNGYSLVTPFPGASNSASGSLGANSSGASSAASVSGAAVPTSFYITGNRGISTFLPGNFTGNPAVGGVAGGTSGGVSVTIQVGSGSDQAGGSVSTTAAASRTNPADGGRNAPIMAYIGMPTTGGAGTPTLPAGQAYATAPAPVPALPPLGQVIPGSPMGTSTAGMIPGNPLNPQGSAPMFRPGTTSLVRPLPGGLGISGGLLSPSN